MKPRYLIKRQDFPDKLYLSETCQYSVVQPFLFIQINILWGLSHIIIYYKMKKINLVTVISLSVACDRIHKSKWPRIGVTNPPPKKNHMTKIRDGAFTKGNPRKVENGYCALLKRGSIAVKQDQSHNVD